MRLALVLFAAMTAQACSLSYTVKPPAPGTLQYGGGPTAAPALAMRDARDGRTPFSDGRIHIAIRFEGAPSELAYLQKEVPSLLRARGIALAEGTDADPVSVVVRDFSIRNQRVSSFSPMVTFTRFSADVTHASQTARIAVYTKQAKTPVWSMGELSEPCFNRPLQLVVRELAAKLNRYFIGARASDSDVAALRARAAKEEGADLLVVIEELGASNHPSALAPLTQLALHPSEEVRGAALGAIGTLGRPESLAQLVPLVSAGASHTDRYMALKAIGDLDSDASRAFLVQLKSSLPDTAEARAQQEIIALYTVDAPAAALAQAAP